MARLDNRSGVVRLTMGRGSDVKRTIAAMTAAAALLAAGGAGDQEKPLRNVTVADLGFVVGHWTAEIWGGTFDEFWGPPAAGTMQGFGRFLSGGKVTFMEFASIEPSENGLVMYMVLGQPSKGSAKPVPFRLTEFKGKRATFSNPENDYPTQIIYEPGRAGRLICTLRGKEDGVEKTDVFDFRRVAK